MGIINVNDNELMFWVHDEDLSVIVNFHNEIKRLIHNEIVSINKRINEECDPKSEQAIKLEIGKNIYKNTLEPNLRIATFLIMFSHLEEWLFNIKSILAPSVDLDLRKGSIGRFKPVLQAGLGIDLSTSIEWANVLKVENIRNCLLHANGRVDYSKNCTDIQNIVSQSKGFLSIQGNRLILSGEYLLEFQKNVAALVGLAK